MPAWNASVAENLKNEAGILVHRLGKPGAGELRWRFAISEAVRPYTQHHSIDSFDVAGFARVRALTKSHPSF